MKKIKLLLIILFTSSFFGCEKRDSDIIRWETFGNSKSENDWDMRIKFLTQSLDANIFNYKTYFAYKSYYGRAKLYFFKGNYNEALEDINKALKLFPRLDKEKSIVPNKDDIYLLRSDIYGELKNYDNAIKDIEDAMKIGGNYNRRIKILNKRKSEPEFEVLYSTIRSKAIDGKISKIHIDWDLNKDSLTKAITKSLFKEPILAVPINWLFYKGEVIIKFDPFFNPEHWDL